MSQFIHSFIRTNRYFKKVTGFVYAILLLSIHSTYSQKLIKQRPNIIIFLVDDMGWLDTSVPFWINNTKQNKIFRTPNMELLAAEGMKFTNAYANPVCTPSRVSMLTGVSAAKHHVINWTSPFKNNNTDNVDDQMGSAKWNMNGLSNVADIPHTFHATTFPSLLKASGYFTIHVGKAHWGSSGTPGSNPYNLGFMVNISGQSSGHPQSYLGAENYGNVPMKPTIQAVSDLQEYHGSNTFLTEALTQEALKTLDAPIQQGQPFFLHLSHYAVHVPLQADSRFVQRYLDMGLDTSEANYASLVEGMDKSLGDVMHYLKEKKVDQNTIILFMSDNGGLSLSGRGIRGRESHTQNLPLKAGKGSVYEGGIRIPFIVKWPGITHKGSVTNTPVIVDDLFPTIMDMAGIKKYHTIQSIDGRSMINVLNNPNKLYERTFIWHYPVKWTNTDGPGINFHSAIRKGDWKLIYNMRNGQSELYNIKEDIGELKDLSNHYPTILKELKSSLSDSLRKWKAPMPIFKSTNTTVPMPDEL